MGMPVSIPACFPEGQEDVIAAMLLRDEMCVNDPQMILDVIAWACENGGEGRAMELLAWLSIEFNLCMREEDEEFIKHRVGLFLDNVRDNHPEWMVGEDQPCWVFPPQLSGHERWLTLHLMRDIMVPLFDQHGQEVILTTGIGQTLGMAEQGLLDALAWRIHQAGETSPETRMALFEQICAEFPRSGYFSALIRDPMDFRCPVGDWQAIRKDALAWEGYYSTVHAPKVAALHDALLQYERAIKGGGLCEDAALYDQYREQWNGLTGKSWPDIRLQKEIPDLPSPF